MNKKSYIVAPGRQVDADRAYLEGDVIDLGEDHMPALLACGAVIEKGQSPEEIEAEHKAAEEAAEAETARVAAEKAAAAAAVSGKKGGK